MAEKTRAQTRTRSPHHRVVYSNQVGSTTSATEIRLRFGIIEEADAERMAIEDQVDIIVGPVMAAKLRDLLDGLIKKHFVIEEAVREEQEAK